jgi:ribonuclease-3
MTTRRARSGKNVTAPALAELEEVLGHSFERQELLTLALTHRSYVYDAGNGGGADGGDASELSDPSRDNEQLEFVGDAVLGLLVAESLCRRFPGSREGELTRMRASVVSRKHLGEVGKRLGVGRWLRLGRTLEENSGRSNVALFSNAVEAMIAALYVDGGLEVARRFVETEVVGEAMPRLEKSLAEGEKFSGAVGDHKSALQEFLQAEGIGQPQYRLVKESGPAHRLVFHVEVTVGDETLAEAEGTSKKVAQQEAARIAFGRLVARRGTHE